MSTTTCSRCAQAKRKPYNKSTKQDEENEGALKNMGQINELHEDAKLIAHEVAQMHTSQQIIQRIKESSKIVEGTAIQVLEQVDGLTDQANDAFRRLYMVEQKAYFATDALFRLRHRLIGVDEGESQVLSEGALRKI
jgi:hypothetical protein